MMFFTEGLPRDACTASKRNPNHALFRQFCFAVCSQKLVTQEDYHAAVDWYISLARGGSSCTRKINYRCVQVVSLKYRRTSFLYDSNNYPRSVFMALKSHNAISSRNDASLSKDKKSVGGRWTAHPVRRFFSSFQRDFFGYPKKGSSTQLASATARVPVLCRTGSALISDQVVR